MNKQVTTVKDKYKIINWANYNESLKQRGNITIWFTDDLKNSWEYSGQRNKGGKIIFSDTAIQVCLMIRQVYKLKLRQTEGFMKSLVGLMKLEIPIPEYTRLCKRAKDLKICLTQFGKNERIDIVLDSTGLKVYGEGEWKVRKHGAGKHRTWRKLHIAINPNTQEIVAEVLTENNVDDGEVVPEILESIPKCKSFRGDGAYDKVKVRKSFDKETKQIIPPQHNAVISKKSDEALIQRDRAIKRIKEVGRAQWKKEEDYHKRSLGEVVMFRYKTIIGDKLMSRKFENEVVEVKIACLILNIMTKLGMPISKKAA